MTRQTGIKASILAHLSNYPGHLFTTDELARALGIIHRATVHSSILRLKEEGAPIDSPTKGVYVYRAEPAAPAAPAAPAVSELSAELLQVIARTSDVVIVRDEASKILVLKIVLQ